METSTAQEKQKSTLRQRGHTPFCSDTCNLQHHDLITALCLDRRKNIARIHLGGVLPTALKVTIESLKLQGWDINSEIPDPLEGLRCPLLYLACAFGKIRIVDGLLQLGFKPHVVTRRGETALHGAVRFLYDAGSFVQSRKSVDLGNNLSTTTERREEAFFSILSLLTECCPRILAFKDSCGFTALHLSAFKMTRPNCNDNYRRYSKPTSIRRAFHQYCLKTMLKKLFELEAGSLLTKHEVIEILTTSENGCGESLLHILARDSKGLEVLKFVRDLLLSLGIGMPNEKNQNNETVCSVACQTNLEGAAEIFLDPSHQQQDTSTATHSEILRGTGAHDLSIDKSMPQVYHNFENATDYPCPGLSVSSSEPEVDEVEPRILFMHTPRITHTFSLAGSEEVFEDCTHPSSLQPPKREDIPVETASTASDDFEIVETWASDRRADWDQQRTDGTSQLGVSESVETSSTSSNDIEIVKPRESDDSSDISQLPWLQSDGTNDIESDSSFLEFVLTEGISLDTLGKCDIVSVVLTKHKEKLRELEETLPQIEKTLTQSETSIVQKTVRLNLLQKEVDSLKKEIAEKNKSRNELRQKVEMMNEEKNLLKRRVEHCEETQNLLTSPTKKARL